MLTINIGKRIISTDKPAFVMGIVNATPDSFFSKSRGDYKLAMELIKQGADILDIGGESTRPGFTEVSAEEEIKRIIPLIEKIRQVSNIPISVDTRKASVLKAAVNAGADILNDVSAMEDDSQMVQTVKELDCGLILMHRFNEPEENRITDSKVVEKVTDYLLERAAFAINNGVEKEKIILDPGIGFGKTTEENLLLIKDCKILCQTGYPVLMALSRKRVIGYMTDTTVDERLIGTVCADFVAVEKGCQLIRVHDVKEAVDSLNVMKYLY